MDLKFNKPAAMDWNDYSSRIKANGVAIHKGDVARITKFVVKGDMIEFQLDGGGSGLIEGAGIDYILPYWMARYYNVVSD